jgi:hypothetical protein
MSETPKTVTITALQLHTYHDHEYQPGATYEADEGDVTTIEVQGKGARADAEKPAEPAKASKPITPLGTDNFPKL